MKTKNSLSLVLLFAVLSLPFAGCKKAWDHINNGPGKDLKICNIKKITTPYRYGPDDFGEANFTYNQWGNPEKIIKTSNNFPLIWFQYDNKQRLIAVFGGAKYPADGDNVRYEKFIYNDDGSITDTIFKSADYMPSGPKPYTGGIYFARRLEFDDKERINKITETVCIGYPVPHTTNGPTTTLYKYDKRGNLMGSGGTEADNAKYYDNYTSILRTNKVWMFLNSDYSVNNRLTAWTVSCFGLPTDVIYRDASVYIFGAHTDRLPSSRIEYTCDCGNIPAL